MVCAHVKTHTDTHGGVSQQRRLKTEKQEDILGSVTIWLFIEIRVSKDWGFPFEGTYKKASRRLGSRSGTLISGKYQTNFSVDYFLAQLATQCSSQVANGQ